MHFHPSFPTIFSSPATLFLPCLFSSPSHCISFSPTCLLFRTLSFLPLSPAEFHSQSSGVYLKISISALQCVSFPFPKNCILLIVSSWIPKDQSLVFPQNWWNSTFSLNAIYSVIALSSSSSSFSIAFWMLNMPFLGFPSHVVSHFKCYFTLNAILSMGTMFSLLLVSTDVFHHIVTW